MSTAMQLSPRSAARNKAAVSNETMRYKLRSGFKAGMDELRVKLGEANEEGRLAWVAAQEKVAYQIRDPREIA
eukprot:SAG11_NODE_28290_length_323_cov_0.910714_1_plen_72_part_01